MTATDAEKYADTDSIESIIGSMAMENKTELTLYAVWEDTAAGGETVEPQINKKAGAENAGDPQKAE